MAQCLHCSFLCQPQEKRVHSKGSVHGGEVGQQEPDKAHHVTPSVRKQSRAGGQRGIESEERKKHWG